MCNLQACLSDLIINQPPIKPPSPSQLTSLNGLIHAALFQEAGRLRDELYWQVLKHLHSNPNRDQVEEAWKLLSCLTASFPASKLLTPFLTGELARAADRFEGSFRDDYYAGSEANLWMFSITGPRGYVTTLTDISIWFNEVRHLNRLFGVRLTEITEWVDLIKGGSTDSSKDSRIGSTNNQNTGNYNQSKSNSQNNINYNRSSITDGQNNSKSTSEYGHTNNQVSSTERIPKIVLQLTEMIINLDGPRREGIFRISGDLQQVLHLKTLLSVPGVRLTYTEQEAVVEANGYEVRVHDPAVPCSLLKLWLRVLREPLLPDPLYSLLLDSRHDPVALKLLLLNPQQHQLPAPNHALLRFLLRFLRELAQDHHSTTKMDLTNFGMIFAPCLMRCPIKSAQQVMEQSKLERELMSQLFMTFDEK